MTIESSANMAVIDHIFIFTVPGAPAAAKLRRLGLMEGTPNQHPGQGTACRRFFFRNAMLELLWIDDAVETRERANPRLQLWERGSASRPGTSPFGIILRSGSGCPFPFWEYRPPSMPGFTIQVSTSIALDEPLWCYQPAGHAPSEAPPERRQPLDHPASLGELTGIKIIGPRLDASSLTAAMARKGILSLDRSAEHRMELDGAAQSRAADLRPDLPVILRW